MVRVQASTGSRTPNSQPAQAFRGATDALSISFHRAGIAAKFLPKAHRYGVLQMCAPGLDYIVEFCCLAIEGFGQIADDSQ